MNIINCKHHKYWHETIDERGKRNVCQLCCEDYYNCKGKLIGKNWGEEQ